MKPVQKPDPTALVIFGGSGDLTWRKLMPALYDLYIDEWIAEKFKIICVDIKDYSVTKLREHLHGGIKKFARHRRNDNKAWKEFSSAISYQKGDFTENKLFKELADKLEKLKEDWNSDICRVFYMAVPPQFIGPIAKQLAESKLMADKMKSRIVVEKPFGHDYMSAFKLNQLLCDYFDEESIYRIDHFLGKETVQNIMAFRFANTLFEPIWNRNYIDHIQITVSEKVGVAHRGAYYEKAGGLRDMLQNHLLQLVCLVAMEPPNVFTADEVRSRKLDVLHAIRKFRHNEVHDYAVRGQYGPGWVEGKKVKGYRQEPDVAPDSNTETFVALKFYVDNWRWQNVPYYVRTGKRMPERFTIITIQFRPVPHQSFPLKALENMQPNRLTINDLPEKGIGLRFQAKRPGLEMFLNPVDMLFNYSEAYHGKPPEAYETLLLDVMLGDATLFMRRDQIEAAWKIVDPIIEVWNAGVPADFPNYPAGRLGPEEAEALIARDGHNWISSPLRASNCRKIEEAK